MFLAMEKKMKNVARQLAVGAMLAAFCVMTVGCEPERSKPPTSTSISPDSPSAEGGSIKVGESQSRAEEEEMSGWLTLLIIAVVVLVSMIIVATGKSGAFTDGH